MRFYKNISLKLLFISLILIVILPLLIFGDFQQDDFYISSLNNLDFKTSFSSIISQFSNRPLAAIFFSILSIFFYSYKHFFVLNVILILFSCNFIIKTFKEYFISKSSRVIFTVLCLLPIYSYSTIFSPGMQITGNLSIFIWSISIYFLNKFIKTEKFFYLVVSNIVLFLMFMTYESALPLIILNLFLPFFKKNLIKFKYIFIALLLILMLSAVVQKLILPHLFNQDISRLRVDDLNINSFILYMGANLLLSLNIFYILIQNFSESLTIILNSNILLAQFLISLGIFFLMVLINYSENLMINLKDNNNFLIILMIICFFVLLAFMHTAAKSAINIYGINNRALVSLSFFVPLILIFLSNMKNPKYFFFIISIYIVVIITNYIPIQHNNITYIKERNTSLKNIIQKINIDHEKENNSFIYLDQFNNNSLYSYTTYTNDNFDFSNMIGFNHYNLQGDHSIWGANIRNSMFCNKAYWNLHFKNKILEIIKVSKKIFFIERNYNQYILKEFNNYNLFNKFIDKKIICSSDIFYQDFLNNKFNKISNKDFINNSKFIKKTMDIYISLN